MTNLHKLTTAFLLSAILLLSGCAGEEPVSVPEDSIETSSDISHGNSSESSETSSESSETSDNSTSTISESSTTEISDNESELQSSSDGSSNTNDYTIPIELTEEDKELQKILEDLRTGTNALDAWFTNGAPDNKSLVFQFPEINHPILVPYYQSYGSIPDGYSEAGFVIPNTCDGIRNFMLEYFSERCTNSFMDQVGTGRMTEDPDGTLNVMLDDREWNPKFLEIDGKMYREDSWGGRGLSVRIPESDTAKIVSKTDDTIEFTYLTTNWLYYDFDDNTYKEITDEAQYAKSALTGVLKYERGGWRRDWDKDDT